MKKALALTYFLFLLVCLYPNQNFWINNCAKQTTVKQPETKVQTIEAKVEDNWQTFKIVMLPQKFIDWNFSNRKEMLKVFKDMIKGEASGTNIKLSGPHNGIVATYGYKRDDASFSLNNAVKGMGFLPKENKIKEVIDRLEKTIDSPMIEKLNILEELYDNSLEIFCKDKQVSLELYSNQESMTQTFLNQMSNPISTIVFLDMTSFKLKTIVRILDPNDLELSEYDKDTVRYVNLVHSYFHGNFSQKFITVVYYVNQVYDNSPRGKNPETGMGKLIVP